MMDLNDLLAMTLLSLLWLAISVALWRSLRSSDARPLPVPRELLAARPSPVARSVVVRSRRTDLPNHTIHAWPGR